MSPHRLFVCFSCFVFVEDSSFPNETHVRTCNNGLSDREFYHLTSLEKEDEISSYHQHISPFFDFNNIALEIPLLEDVFKRFYGRIRFNVELKGTNPLLGPRVLEIAKPYPGIIARISSFLWNIPKVLCGNPLLCWDDNMSHLKAKDLLKGIISNEDGIPLALLIGTYLMPSVSKVLFALDTYSSEWLHIPQVRIKILHEP